MFQALISKQVVIFASLFLFIQQPVNASQSYIFKNVQVLSFSQGKFIGPTNVTIRDGKIISIEDDFSKSDGVEIAANGAYLIPGFTEMHAHIPPEEIKAEELEDLLFLYNAYGITTIRSMLGHPSHLVLQEQLANNQVNGPRLITSGPSFNGNSVNSAQQAKSRVSEQAKLGYDFIKIHPGMNGESFQAMAVAAKEYRLPFAGHVSSSVGIIDSVKAGQASIDHLDGVMEELAKRSGLSEQIEPGFFGAALVDHINEDEIEPLAKQLAQTPVAMVPTETLMVGFLSWQSADVAAQKEEIKLMPASEVEHWKKSRSSMQRSDWYSRERIQKLLNIRRAFLNAYVQHQGLVLVGSDAPQVFNVPGDSFHQEMHLMTQAGMTPLQVLLAATLAPATYFHKDPDFGEIAEGKSADLILLAKDPLQDISHTRSILGVMTRGHWLDKAEIEGSLQDIKLKHKEID